jgi:hypothetical protein
MWKNIVQTVRPQIIIVIRKEDIEKDISSNTEGKRRVETQNKLRIGKSN